MELFSGLLFSYSYIVFDWGWGFLYALILVALFHIIIVSDLAYMIIPDRVLLFFFFILLLYRSFHPLMPYWASIAGGLIGLAGIALIILISRSGMGGGDMKLFGLIGFAMGVKMLLVTFFLATLLGAILGGVLLATGTISRAKPIPFGPFIAVSALIVVFSGPLLIDWYVTSFF
ncbi:A24 family peptidase [Halobacillus salinarum]|uniref:A24 family peptidase n=2 Tax=Halobacillus salinarum TaxID=2932257 RepID=A0ABY4ERU6_9BACI|nr:A24 family peptidase [Halobacillus salinarum]